MPWSNIRSIIELTDLINQSKHDLSKHGLTVHLYSLPYSLGTVSFVEYSYSVNCEENVN